MKIIPFKKRKRAAFFLMAVLGIYCWINGSSPQAYAQSDLISRWKSFKEKIEALKAARDARKTKAPSPLPNPGPAAPGNFSEENPFEVRVGPPNASVQVKISAASRIWNPMLGGVIWLPSREAAEAQAAVFREYPGELLAAVKQDPSGFGYRFDLNFWEPASSVYGWFPWDGSRKDAVTLDQIFQIYGKPNVRFTLSLPLPAPDLKLGDERFAWQTPAYYGALCQYLFGKAGVARDYAALPLQMDFFKTAPEFNWANLRARRGRVEPYRTEAVILGVEPYYVEGWAQRGKEFGAAAEAYRKEIRKRGIRIPYGTHVSQLPAVDREWFHPMMDQFDPKDLPEFFDLYHHYTFSGTDDWERSYPASFSAKGFSNDWKPRNTWRSEYRRYLWLIQDTSAALKDRGVPEGKAKLGFSEHGITISSKFRLNDMKAALHYALWLSETMVYGTQWDSMWTLTAQGFSAAQIQYVGGIVTRTPAFYLYQMVMKLRGLYYLETASDSRFGKTAPPKGEAVYFPWTVVRVFEGASKDRRFIFAVHQHNRQPVTLQGFEGWKIISWEQLSGPSYDAQNPIDRPGPEKIRTEKKTKKPEALITLDPVSVSLIEIAR